MSSYLTSYLPSQPKPFDRPTLLYTILAQPIKSLLRLLDFAFSLLRSNNGPRYGIRLVCLSDTHTLIPPSIPDGDILIHAGDLTNAGTPAELQAQINWLATQPHRYKIVIAGNHDTYLDPESRATLPPALQRDDLVHWPAGLTYLQHSSTTLHLNPSLALTLHGCPQVPSHAFGPEHAFTYPLARDAWSRTVPLATDILITHSPPKYSLDLPQGTGCPFLAAEVRRVKPLVHVFGHVHAGRSDWEGWLRGGQRVVCWDGSERALRRGLERRDGFFVQGLLDPRAWADVGLVVWYGVRGVLWEWVWGGRCERTVMVNAALTFEDTGRLGNGVQVIDI